MSAGGWLRSRSRAVPLFLRIVFFCDEVGKAQQKRGTTDGIHQGVNSWTTAAPNQRGRLRWRLLFAGDARSAISRPRRSSRRRLARGDSKVSSIDETHQWLNSPRPQPCDLRRTESIVAHQPHELLSTPQLRPPLLRAGKRLLSPKKRKGPDCSGPCGFLRCRKTVMR